MRDRTQFTGLDEFEGSCALGWMVAERLNPHASKNEAMRHTEILKARFGRCGRVRSLDQNRSGLPRAPRI